MSDVGEGTDRKKAWYLQHLDIFAGLTKAEVEEVASLLHDHHVPAGVDLLGSRQRDQIYIVKEGAVRIDVHDDGHRATAALLGPRRLFGLSSSANETGVAVSAVAVVPSYVCIATWSELIEVLVRYPLVLPKMMSSLAEQVFRIEGWRARRGKTVPRVRLAQLLLELASEVGEPNGDGRTIPFRLERADLACMLGLSRETVSRIMAEFERCGWVTRERGYLTVSNTDELESLATPAAHAGVG